MLQWTNASHAHSHVPALGSAWQHKVSDRHTHQKPETNRRRAHRQSRKASGQSQLTRTTQVSCNLPFLLLTNTSLKKKDQWNLHRKPGGGEQRRGTRSLRQPEPAGEPSPCPWRRIARAPLDWISIPRPRRPAGSRALAVEPEQRPRLVDEDGRDADLRSVLDLIRSFFI